MLTLDALKQGQTGIVQNFTDDFLALKFIEMGCYPGEKVTLSRISPFGDPIIIEISGSLLSMRKPEASKIVVKLTTEK